MRRRHVRKHKQLHIRRTILSAPPQVERRFFLTGGSGFIGTHLVEELLKRGVEVENFDFKPPVNPNHAPLWKAGDLWDADALRMRMHAFEPDALLHLAARANCDENTTVEDGYRANTDNTHNLLDAVKATPSVRHAPKIPRPVVRLIALAGDAITAVRGR